MHCETVYTPDMFPEMKKTGYYYQFVENRQLSHVPHKHDFYEICMILNGQAIQEVNGETVTLSRGELVILSPRDAHCFVQQSEEMVGYLMKDFGEDPRSIWESNLFGRSLYDLMTDGLHAKLEHMPDDARQKFGETLSKIINEGSQGLICMIV